MRHKQDDGRPVPAGRRHVVPGGDDALPAMYRSEKLQQKAAAAGFDWPDALSVLAKLEEELGELRQALRTEQVAACREELGDILFTCMNLARRLGSDGERILHQANRKFELRFSALEQLLAVRGRSIAELSLHEMEQAWQRVKRTERDR